MTKQQRCGWCGGALPAATGLGRPRRYCGQPCRQRAYEHRQQATRAGLDTDAVIVSAAELDHLQDRLFQLRCAVQDVETALCEEATTDELHGVVGNLTDSIGGLDRLWINPRVLR